MSRCPAPGRRSWTGGACWSCGRCSPAKGPHETSIAWSSVQRPRSEGALVSDLSADEFIARAQRFLTGLGVSPAALDPDADLVATGVLDSLLLLAFLAFVEEQRGHEAPIQP